MIAPPAIRRSPVRLLALVSKAERVHCRPWLTHNEYFFSTDATTATATIGACAGPWDIETTSQGVRSHPGPEGTRGRCRRTVLRAAPRPFGLDSVVALPSRGLPEPKRAGRVEWPGRVGVAFSDAITSVRRGLWRGWVFARAGGGSALEQLPDPLHRARPYALPSAA